MEDAALLGAYLLYYWPVSYTQVSLAMALSRLSPRRVLDLGSGPAPVAAALFDSLGSGEASERIVLADCSGKALALGAAILDRGSPRPGSVECVELDLMSALSLPQGPFDLIAFGHCLNELGGRSLSGSALLKAKLGLVDAAADRLAPGGVVLLLEPALLATSRALIELRDKLLERGWTALGPCPGSYPCPALVAGPDRSCHEEAPWNPPEPVASLAKAAGLDRSSVKLSCFLLAPPGFSAADRLYPERPAGLRRVVSDPMLNKAGRLRYILCGNGALAAVSARADDEAARENGFLGLRRGDALVPRGLESRPGGGLGIVAGSELGINSLAPEVSP